MSWWRQVRHVARKDARQFWWLLGAFAAVTVAATVGAAEVFGPYEQQWRGPFGLLSTGGVLPVLTYVTAALLIQADSPTASDAFWSTRPFAPSAVFSAKLLLLGLVLLGLPVVGQSLALLAHGADPADLAGLLARSALNQASAVAGAAFLAALTRDLKGFVLAVIVAFFGFMLYQRLLVSASPPDLPTLVTRTDFRTGLFLVGGLGLLALLYRTRALKVAYAGVAVLSVVLVAAMPFLSSVGPRWDLEAARAATAPPELVDEAIVIDEIDVQPAFQRYPGEESGLLVLARLSLPTAPEGYAYHFERPTVKVTFPNGETEHHRPEQWRVQLASPTTPDGGPTWLRGTDASSNQNVGQHIDLVRLSERQAGVLAGGGARVEITGRVEVLRPDLGSTLPLRSGAELSHGPRRVRITSLREIGGVLNVVTHAEDVPATNDWQAFGRLDPFGYALLHRERNEAVALFGGMGTGAHPLVLSGVQIPVFDNHLEMPRERPWEAASDPIDRAWLDEAELLLIARETIGDYPVTLLIDDFRLPAADGDEGPASQEGEARRLRLRRGPAAAGTSGPGNG